MFMQKMDNLDGASWRSGQAKDDGQGGAGEPAGQATRSTMRPVGWPCALRTGSASGRVLSAVPEAMRSAMLALYWLTM